MDPFTAALVRQHLEQQQMMQAMMTQAPHPLAMGAMPQGPSPYTLPGGPMGPGPQPYALPSSPMGADWQTTGVFPNGGFDANNINASNPAARQNALHILNDYAGENRESQGMQDAQSNMDLAQQNQDQTGYYGYGSLG